jgi:hypothetical protein
MPGRKSHPLERSLNALMAAAISGNHAKAESLTNGLVNSIESMDEHIRDSMEVVAKLIHGFEYEKAIIKIKQFIHNLSLESNKKNFRGADQE